VRRVLTAESVTQLDAGVRGAVLVAGSHGGMIAAYYAADAGVHAVILNDAGIGLEEAGVAGLAWLESIGMAAAAVSHATARIGDGADMLVRGRISRANALARAAGVQAGERCADAALRLGTAPAPRASLPRWREARFLLQGTEPQVWGLDSIGMVEAADTGRFLVIGSHGALHGGRPESALGVHAAGAVFNDAGIGADGVGVTRLPVLDARGIPGATVDCMSARIGDCRSMWRNGVLSRVNSLAERVGVVPGMSVAALVERLREAR
jgi:pimeloyl-ACP methyl ester carboxylesterase